MGAYTALAAAVAAVLLAQPTTAETMYHPLNTRVKTIIGDTYQEEVANFKGVTMLEFYAPWCGHCQNLKPIYEKAAESLVNLANVAAVNCDDEWNKKLCSKFEIKGFPTIKIIKPGKKVGKPFIEDYNGPRTAQAIVDVMIDKIPNHVKKIKNSDFDKWLHENEARGKGLLFSDKGTISPSYKSLAIDLLGTVDLAQASSSDKKLVKQFNIKTFPTLIGFAPTEKDQPPRFYKGKGWKKFDMAPFFVHLNSPIEEHRKGAKAKKDNFFQVPEDYDSATVKPLKGDLWEEYLAASKAGKVNQDAKTKIQEQGVPTESPDPKIIPEDTELPVANEPSTSDAEALPQIPILEDESALQSKCLNTNAGTCILAILPKDLAAVPAAFDAVTNLGRVHTKHQHANRKLFPFFQLAPGSHSDSLRTGLGLSGDKVELIAINGKRSWYRRYPLTAHGVAELEDWVDSIRMGDGAKEKVPSGLIVEGASVPKAKETPKVDTKDPIAMAEAIRSQLPEGVELELEEIDDAEYERIMKQAEKDASAQEKVDHLVDEL